jgi:arylsulfatase A-like enzyme
MYASEYLQYVNKKKIRMKQEDLEYIEALYDGGVAYTDEYVGQMLEALKGLGLYDSSLIFVTSDHGEEFQEHGYMLHASPYYYDALSHVPLRVKAPGHEGKGRVVDEFVESIDFTPSMLAWAGVKNVPAMQGESFMGLLEDSQAVWKDTVYGFSVKGGPEVSLRNMRWKLMAGDMQKADDYRLYDLMADPQEKVDASDYYEREAAELKGQLVEKFTSLGKPRGAKEAPLTPEQLKILKSLGYVE